MKPRRVSVSMRQAESYGACFCEQFENNILNYFENNFSYSFENNFSYSFENNFSYSFKNDFENSISKRESIIEHWDCVIFQRARVEAVVRRLRSLRRTSGRSAPSGGLTT